LRKYQHQKAVIILFFSLTFFIFCSIAIAQEKEAIGKVVALRGKIIAIDQDNTKRMLALKAPVYLNDTIHTNQGRVQLMFDDNTLITLGRQTHMLITAYSWKPGDKTSGMETKISEGSFRIMGGAITRTAPENFKTHTPSGTIGIRGSMYAGRMENNVLSVLFQGGKGIYVKNEAGMVDINRPGFGTMVKSADHPPALPKKMSQQELNEMEKQLAYAPPEETTGSESPGDEPPPGNDPAEPTGDPIAETGPAETDPTEGDVSEPNNSGSQPTGDSNGETEQTTLLAVESSDSTGETIIDPATQTDGAPLTTDPLGGGSDILSIAGDAVLSSTQDSLNNDLQPTGTQQKIELLLLGLGYSDSLSKSTSLPSSGIWTYAGKMQNTQVSEPDQSIKFLVNWDTTTHRIMAFEPFNVGSTNQGTGFGFGSVTATGDITGINVFGTDTNSGNVRALSGSETFGQFYGSSQAGLGLALEGYDVEVQNQANQFFWSDIMAATVNSKAANTNTTTTGWEGFYVGVAEDMTSPNSNRRVFHNTSAGSSDFSLSIDITAGTLSGSMSGEDFNTASNTINTMTIGGGVNDSVYIDDQNLAATFSGTNVITISPSSTDLKTYGNYMVSSKKTALSNYTTWGYWEVAYQDPVSTKPYHLHVPGSLWIAGEPTPPTAVATHISNNFIGMYTVKAEGVMFDSTSQMSQLTQLTCGPSDLSISFNSGAVSGNLVFDQVSLPVAGGTVTATPPVGFTATISSAASSEISGTFYGPNAESIGGNFSAQMVGGTEYHGIFGGNR